MYRIIAFGFDLRQKWRLGMLARLNVLCVFKENKDEKNTGRRKLENARIQDHGP